MLSHPLPLLPSIRNRPPAGRLNATEGLLGFYSRGNEKGRYQHGGSTDSLAAVDGDAPAGM